MRTPKPKQVESLPPIVTAKPRKKRKLWMAVLLGSLIPAISFPVVRFASIYEGLCEQNAEQTAKLNAITEEVERLREDLSNERSSHSEKAAALKELISLHLSRLISFAGYIADNPSRSGHVLREALQFATIHGLETKQLQAQIESLPKSKPLDPKTELKVLSASHTLVTSTVDVAVSDLGHVRVEGLGRVDFDVKCRGKEVPSFRVEPTTVAYGDHRVSVLVDCSGSILESFPDAKRALKSFVSEVADPWKLHVISFASEVRSVTPWTHDASVHLQAIDSLVANGGTELFAALELDAKEHAKFKGTHTTVLLTDGKDSRGIADVSKIIKEYQVTGSQLHVIALDRGEIDEPILRRLASETNGTFQKIGQARELASLLKVVAETMKQPIYRLTILGPVDRESLSIQLSGREVPVAVKTRLSLP